MHANGFAKKILPWYYKLQDKCANKFVVKVTIIILSNGNRKITILGNFTFCE